MRFFRCIVYFEGQNLDPKHTKPAKVLASAKIGADITENLLTGAKRGLVTRALDEIEALAGAGQLDDARRVIARLRALDSKATEDALRQRLMRVGQLKIAG